MKKQKQKQVLTEYDFRIRVGKLTLLVTMVLSYAVF